MTGKTPKVAVEGFVPEQWLLDAGFVYDYDKHTEGIQTAQDIGMDAGGPFAHQGVYVRGSVTIEIQQNTDTQTAGGMEMTVKHPPVAVVEGPKGRCAANPANRAGVLELADELS